MTENEITQNYCKVSGIDVDHQSNLRRFGNLFCSDVLAVWINMSNRDRKEWDT